MAQNIPINGQLTFVGSIAGQCSVQAQPQGGTLTLLLPNVAPNLNQTLTATAVSGFQVTLGWSDDSSDSVYAPLASPTFTGTVILPSTNYTGLFNELASDTITAHAGGTQAAAFQLTAQTNRVTVVATAGDSVKLPASAAGLEIVVINHGANPMQVFGAGTDTIDDIATAVGVSQMVNSVVIYACATAGAWYTEGLANGYAGGFQTVSTLDTITAAGTNQGTAFVLPARMAYNVTSTPSGTGVLLPASVAGAELAVNNIGGLALLVYPNGTETINTTGAGVALSCANNTVTIFYCFTAGKWYTK